MPVVGGGAILVAGALAGSITHGGGGLGQLPWTALACAFLLGFVDDVLPGGLKAMHKLCGQLVVGLLLALEPGALIGDVGVLEAVGLGLLAVVSMNAINTWDHADGLTGGLSAVALATGAPGLAAAVAGYLPFNTFLRQPLAGAGPSPRAPARMVITRSWSDWSSPKIASGPAAPSWRPAAAAPSGSSKIPQRGTSPGRSGRVTPWDSIMSAMRCQAFRASAGR